MLTDSSWWWLLLSIAAGVAAALGLYWRGSGRLLRWQRVVLAAVRALAVAVIVWLLQGVVVRRTVHESQRPRLLLAEDRSLSVASSADSSFSLDGLASALSGRFDIIRFYFGDSLSTDIGSALSEASRLDADVIVLASDGVHNRGVSPLAEAQRMAATVHCVALGDTARQRDAWLADLHTGRVATRGTRFAVELSVAANGLAGKASALTARCDGTDCGLSERVVLDDGARTMTLMLPADREGLHRYTVSLRPVDGEWRDDNNEISFYVDVVDTRAVVAVVADAPHPDVAAIRLALASSPDYEVRYIPASELSTARLDDVKVAVTHNLPSPTHPSLGGIDNMPTLHIVGLRTDLRRFSDLRTGLELRQNHTATEQHAAVAAGGFSLFSYDEADMQTIESLPPLDAPFASPRVSAGVQTLFTARIGTVDSRQPLVCATAAGATRHAVIWGEGLWRWRLAEYAQNGQTGAVDRLINRLVRFCTLAERGGRLQVDARRSYMAGEPIELRAVHYNESFEPDCTADVMLELTGPDGSSEYLFSPGSDTYTLRLPPMPEGVYRWKATTGGDECNGVFAVENASVETRDMTADHRLLATLAEGSGGGLFRPSTVDSLSARLSEVRQVIYTRHRFTSMASLPWVFALIVLLLAAEWGLRKYWGEL